MVKRTESFGDGIFLRSFPSRREAIEEELPRIGYLARFIKTNGWLTEIETLLEIESIIQLSLPTPPPNWAAAEKNNRIRELKDRGERVKGFDVCVEYHFDNC